MSALWNKVTGSRRRKVAAAIVTSVLVAGTAIAAWSVLTATGSGSAKVGALTPPTITQVAAPSGDLFPNETTASGSLQMTINNPASNGAMFLKAIKVSDAASTGGGAGCDWSDHSPTGFEKLYLYVGTNSSIVGPAGVTPYNTGSTLSIPVPVGSSTVTVPGIIGLMNNTPTECQGTTIQGLAVTDASFSTAP